MIFDFSFVNVVYDIELRMLDHPCVPRMNPTWSWCVLFFIPCWIQLDKILLRILCLYSSKRLAYNFPFWYYHCLVLVLG